MFTDALIPAGPQRHCRRCGHPVPTGRLIDGLGSGCAELLGLTPPRVRLPRPHGETTDGPNLIDLIDNGDNVTTLTAPDLIETLAEAVHDQWMATKRAQGITSRRSEAGEELMRPYAALSDGQRDLDRNSVLAVLGAAGRLGYELTRT